MATSFHTEETDRILTIMREPNVEELMRELYHLYEEKCSTPFPHAGCRDLLQEMEGQYDLFVPHLDLYFLNIAGYCFSAKKIVKWPIEEIEKVLVDLKETFFEKHPQYAALEPLITESRVSDLYQALGIYEEMRKKLLEILSCLLAEDQLDKPTQV